MQKVRIPVSVDPVKSAVKGLQYTGLVPGVSLSRLADTVLTVTGDADVSVRFDVDQQRTHYFAGRVEAAVEVTCQRCNKPMQLHLDASFSYAPVYRRQQEEDIPQMYEPVKLNELGEVMLHEIVEDELLLALPIVTMHAEQDCEVDRNAMTYGELPAEAEERANPFAVLQGLKRK